MNQITQLIMERGVSLAETCIRECVIGGIIEALVGVALCAVAWRVGARIWKTVEKDDIDDEFRAIIFVAIAAIFGIVGAFCVGCGLTSVLCPHLTTLEKLLH